MVQCAAAAVVQPSVARRKSTEESRERNKVNAVEFNHPEAQQNIHSLCRFISSSISLSRSLSASLCYLSTQTYLGHKRPLNRIEVQLRRSEIAEKVCSAARAIYSS